MKKLVLFLVVGVGLDAWVFVGVGVDHGWFFVGGVTLLWVFLVIEVFLFRIRLD